MQLFRRFCIQKLVKFHMKTVQTALDLLRYENKKNYAVLYRRSKVQKLIEQHYSLGKINTMSPQAVESIGVFFLSKYIKRHFCHILPKALQQKDQGYRLFPIDLSSGV